MSFIFFFIQDINYRYCSVWCQCCGVGMLWQDSFWAECLLIIRAGWREVPIGGKGSKKGKLPRWSKKCKTWIFRKLDVLGSEMVDSSTERDWRLLTYFALVLDPIWTGKNGFLIFLNFLKDFHEKICTDDDYAIKNKKVCCFSLFMWGPGIAFGAQKIQVENLMTLSIKTDTNPQPPKQRCKSWRMIRIRRIQILNTAWVVGDWRLFLGTVSWDFLPIPPDPYHLVWIRTHIKYRSISN